MFNKKNVFYSYECEECENKSKEKKSKVNKNKIKRRNVDVCPFWRFPCEKNKTMGNNIMYNIVFHGKL